MAEEGIRFKTGYVGPAFDFAQAGRNIGMQIVADVERKRESERRDRIERDQQYGFTKAMQESLDGKLNNMYRGGAQLLLSDMQEKSSAALVSGEPSAIAAANAAKQEYMAYTNIASAKSAQNNQIRANIVAGNIKGLAGTQEEALADFIEYDKADVRFDENGKLVVADKKTGELKYWAESFLSDVNDLYIPPMMWEGTNYMPENMGKDIYDSLLAQQSEVLQLRDGNGFATGNLDSETAYQMINDELQSRMSLRGPEMLEAMQAIGYKVLRAPGKTELSESDIDEATKFYTEQELFNTVLPDGENIASGSLNDRGEWVFDVSDEEVRNSAVGMEVAVQKRKAIKVYMEQSAQRAYNLIPVKDETAQSERIRREEERLQTEAILEAAADEANKVVYPPIEFFVEPGTKVKTAEGVENSNAVKVKASVSGRTFRFNMSGRLIESEINSQGSTVSDKSKELLTGDIKVEVKNVIHDSETGEILGFDLNTGPGLIEGALLSIDGTPIKNITVPRDSDAYDEVITSMKQIAAPSKTKRSGAQFLYDSETAVKAAIEEKKKKNQATTVEEEPVTDEPVTDESIEREHNRVMAVQQLNIRTNLTNVEEVFDVLESMTGEEKTAMENRIFEEILEKGNIAAVVDGEIVFPE